MNNPLIERIRDLNSPLNPIPTAEPSAIRHLPEIRAVLFDVYGTLLISGSGDVGTDVTTAHAGAFGDVLRSAGLPAIPVGRLFETIRAHQQRARDVGVDFPEIDIVAVWRETLSGAGNSKNDADLQRLAIEFECLVNPVWPMPAATDCLAQLRDSDKVLGIVSNAQFYTPLTLEALLGESPEQLGFAADLQFFSYEFGRAKPSPFLFERAARSLQRRGIAPHQALYVGNDMLKDVVAANGVGFATALFAGDARSLRKRSDDSRVAGTTPSVVLSSLDQLTACLSES